MRFFTLYSLPGSVRFCPRNKIIFFLQINEISRLIDNVFGKKAA
jgi:hypothetical protein